MKRKTKTEKEAEQMAALRVRVCDILTGACGMEDVEDESFFLTLEAASRAIPALKRVFEQEGRDYMWQPHCLDRFETVDKITEFLFRNGARA